MSSIATRLVPTLRAGPLILGLALTAPVMASARQAPWPAARSAHVMAWHAGLDQVVMFGGVPVAEDSALWGWDGRAWRELAHGGPVGRAHFGMAHDGTRNQLVVQGGIRAAFGNVTPERHGDTWGWDGRAWRQVASDGPGVRDHHAMAWDPVRRMIVLFGGADSTGAMLGDTWGWDGVTWRRLADDGPPARATHRMAFDTRRGVLVLFGGWGATGLLHDTWEWDGVRWSARGGAGPAPRFAARLAFDEVRGRVVLFGGRGDGGVNFADTWEWDGADWTRRDLAGPSERNVHAMVYDPRRGVTLLFGGFAAPKRFADLWAYDGTTWREIPRPSRD